MMAQKAKAWRRFIISWSFLLTVAQIVLLCYTIWVVGDGIDEESGMMFGPSVQDLIDVGARDTKLILEKNQWWRLASPIMLHGGFFHLFMNALLQVRVATGLEAKWGSMKFIVIYAFSGVYSFMASAYLLTDSVSVGASGSLMGIMGGWFVHAWITWDPARDLISRITELLSVGFGIVLILSQSFMPRTDWACHVGGLFAGCAVAMAIFGAMLKKRKVLTCVSGFVIYCGLVAATLVPLLSVDTDDICC